MFVDACAPSCLFISAILAKAGLISLSLNLLVHSGFMQKFGDVGAVSVVSMFFYFGIY